GRRAPDRSVDDALVRFEMIAIRNGEFAPQGNAALSHVFDAGEVRLTTGHADHPRAQDGDQLKLAGTVRSIAKKRPDGVSLRPLNVEQEHVRRIRRRLHRKLLEQARLQRSDADNEERAEADGEQDDACLITGTAKMQKG